MMKNGHNNAVFSYFVDGGGMTENNPMGG